MIISFINYLYNYSSLIRLDLDLVVVSLAGNVILEVFLIYHKNVQILLNKLKFSTENMSFEPVSHRIQFCHFILAFLNIS